MKRIFALLLLLSLVILPAFTSCYPGGYDEDNPNRPPDQQVETDDLQQGDDGTATETPVEEPSGE